ncbi:MAG: hypothetical protein JO252_25995 [Planctomycetaceae bacterium]|nr:hypothetical protein [Planctomycetaceae bacterium]MBV8317002.1 hypothetical protein [Planctomycetaceae bacterium]
MSRLPRRTTVLSIAAALIVVSSALFSRAQTHNDRQREPRRGSPNAERAAGVLIKVEPIGKGESSGSKDEGESRKARPRHVSRRLTINTAAVWRDWARDQVADKLTESAKAEAAEGQNSVATKGEPAQKDSLVVVDIGPRTRVEARFRLVADETSKGYKTPEEARSSKIDPAAEEFKGSSLRTRPEPPTHFKAEDLRAGLFVEVDFRHEREKKNRTERDVAAAVTVIRPVEPAE